MDPWGRGMSEEEEEEEFSQGELEAAAVLLEFEQGMPKMSWFQPWGLKKKRSKTIIAMPITNFNYDDEVREQEEQDAHAAMRKRIWAAGGEDKGRKRSKAPEDSKKEGSPTTPLSWSGNERGSRSTSGGGAGDRSDSASPAELRLTQTAPPAVPCDRPLGHRPAFKDQIGDKVHNTSGRRGPKRKTNAELKEQVKELSLEQEEMKKEKKQRLQLLQSLRDANELWKAKLALFGEKEEAKLPVILPEISSDLGQETKGPAPFKPLLGHVELECSENLDVNSPLVQVMEGTSTVANILPPHHVSMDASRTQDILNSVPDRFILPDLNIALSMDESSDKSSGGCDEQVLPPNRAVAAAVARKHRKECRRGKCSQIGKDRFR